MYGAEWWETLFASLSFLTAGFSAEQWFRASRIKVPPSTEDSWDGKGPFSDALARQSQLNARAAFIASMAAVFQAMAIVSKIAAPMLGLR